jgi:protein-disulfide isomerase
VVPLGASGTPTFFVNGRKVVGAQPLEVFKAVIDEELKKAEALVKSGVAPKDVYARTIEKGATSPVTMAAPAAAPAAPTAATAAVVPLRADDAVKGPALAPVTIVVFSDFQCPFCSRVEPTLKQVEQAFPGKVRIAWRHQPLPFHPNAMPAARAAEAARLQGKFWEMHDKLFTDQQALSEASYSKYARELGLDVARFQKEAAGEAAGRRIADDQALAAKVGASGTPTMFVNCRLLSGAQPFEKFKAMVEEELKKTEALQARGEKLDAGFYDRLCAANVASAPAVAAAPPPRTDVKVALRSDDPAVGPAGAKVTVVEFSDFQCPFCSRAVPAVKELEQAFGKEVRVVWKHLPLGFHPNAMPAALAAEAAREQGKFWEMHDKLFANQQALSEASYDQYAAELKLDLPRFKAARQAPETRKRVEADLAAATAAGVSGTPTFVVNGEVVVGSSALKPAVERQLKKAELAKR